MMRQVAADRGTALHDPEQPGIDQRTQRGGVDGQHVRHDRVELEQHRPIVGEDLASTSSGGIEVMLPAPSTTPTPSVRVGWS